MEKRFFLAITLSITVLLLWNHFVSPPVVDPPQQPFSEGTDTATEIRHDPGMITPEPVPVIESDEVDAIEYPEAERQLIRIETSLAIAELDTLGGRITSWKLKEYDGIDSNPVELISPLEPLHYPGDIRINGLAAFGDSVFSTDIGPAGVVLDAGNPEAVITLVSMLRTGEFLRKDFTFHHDKYMINLDVHLTNRSTSNMGGVIEYLVPDRLVEPLNGNATNRYFRSGPVFWDGHSRERPRMDKIQTRLTFPGIRWAAFQENYFFTGIAGLTQLGTAFIEPGRLNPESMKTETVVSGLILDSRSVAPGETIMQRTLLLMGPKKYDELKELGIGIENIVDFGWITFLGKFFYYILTGSVFYLKNFGVGIILITVAVKLILFPLSHKQMQSMKKMQAIQPQMKAIQEKYRKDPQKQQQELGMLYKKHGVNPMGGCLPLLVQFPVFIALYQVLMNVIEMRGASFLWVRDLSQPNVAMVLIMGLSMVIQQKMTPVTGDPRQAKIMMMLPIIFTAMFWNFPSGLVLYWLTNNILTIGQQYIMNRIQAPDGVQEPRVKARVKRKLEERNK